jgi:kynurenine formamidase
MLPFILLILSVAMSFATALATHQTAAAPPSVEKLTIAVESWGSDEINPVQMKTVNFLLSSPAGLGSEAANWLVERQPVLVAADTFPVEVFPNPDKDLFAPVHQILLAINGIYILENLDLEGLARDKVYESAFVLQPLKIKGGTGSTVAPSAIK